MYPLNGVFESKVEKRNGDKTTIFKPLLIGSMSHKFLPTRALLYVSFRHLLINFTKFMGKPNSVIILHKTSILNES